MKTPREILLARHRAAEARLDAIRRTVVAGELNRPDAKAPSGFVFVASLCVRCSNTVWRELILPSRRIWVGLAAVWLLLVIVNVAGRNPVSSVTGQPVRSPSVMMSWQAQQRWMNELLADRAASPAADRLKSSAPKPRSEVIEARIT